MRRIKIAIEMAENAARKFAFKKQRSVQNTDTGNKKRILAWRELTRSERCNDAPPLPLAPWSHYAQKNIFTRGSRRPCFGGSTSDRRPFQRLVCRHRRRRQLGR